MSYCPKCGNKVDETMAFCPRCGASLKAAAPSQAPQPTQQPYRRSDEKSEKNEKQEKNQRQEKGEKGEKGEQGFIGFLIGGLVLITIGAFTLLQLTNALSSGQNWAIMLLVIGVIIIIGAVYVATVARKRYPPPA